MAASTASSDKHFQTCSDWFSFHLSHIKDCEFSKLESLWPECRQCRVVYESLEYTSTQGEFGLMTKEILENIEKVRRVKAYLHLQILLRFLVRFSPFDGCKRVNQLQIFRWGKMHSCHSLSIHSFTPID
jgi:hypothetical protein